MILRYFFKRKKLIPALLHPAFLAIPIYLGILFFADVQMESHKLSVHQFKKHETPNEKIVFQDLNSDGNKEKIRAYNLLTNATIIGYSENESIYEVWNLPGYWFNNPDFIINDLDSDGIKELFALTVGSHDSLFVNQLVLKRRETISESRFVCKLDRFNGKFDQQVNILGFCDISGDGYSDLIFHVSAGFTLQPRAIYGWDLANDTIIRSQESGFNFKYLDQLVTSNPSKTEQDSILLFTNNAATDNYRTAISYSDTGSYVLVYKTGFAYLFDPLYIGGPQSSTYTYPMKANGEDRILALMYDYRRATKKTDLYLLDHSGSVLNMTVTDRFDLNFKIIPFNGQLVIINKLESSTEIGTLGHELTFMAKSVLEDHFTVYKAMNVDNDPQNELILIDPEISQIGILQENMKDFTAIEIPQFLASNVHISVVNSDLRETELFVYSDYHTFSLIFSRNALYPFRFLYYLLLYGLVFSVLFLLQKIFTSTNNRRVEREQKLLKYQLQSVMNQLNPHFTFNAINSIGDAVLEGRNKEAYDYFTKLSDLIRKSMKNAFHPYKTLGEEIDFVKQYLEIEQYRFGEELSWELKVDPLVNLSIPIPKMLIHIFVENSIKHGIFHLKGKGTVSISVTKQKEQIEIIITDNGVGLSRAFEIENKKGEGLRILDDYLDIYNSQERRTIQYILSNHQDRSVSGTQVTIRIK